jgi:hypothetical protein
VDAFAPWLARRPVDHTLLERFARDSTLDSAARSAFLARF